MTLNIAKKIGAVKLSELTRANVINPKLEKNISIEVVFNRPRTRCSRSLVVFRNLKRDLIIIGKITMNPKRLLKKATSKACKSSVLILTRTCIVAAKKVDAIIKKMLFKDAD